MRPNLEILGPTTSCQIRVLDPTDSHMTTRRLCHIRTKVLLQGSEIYFDNQSKCWTTVENPPSYVEDEAFSGLSWQPGGNLEDHLPEGLISAHPTPRLGQSSTVAYSLNLVEDIEHPVDQHPNQQDQKQITDLKKPANFQNKQEYNRSLAP